MSIAAMLKLAERYPVIVTVELASIVVTLWWWSGGNVDMLFLDARALHGQLWRLFTPVLPHVDIYHLAFNLYWVAVFGRRVEEIFGSLRTAAWLLVFAAGSMVAEYALADGGVGLSGVGYGLFGFLWVLAKRDQRFADAISKQTTQLFIAWFFLCLALTYTDVWKVGNVAHAAGAGFGALAGFLMAPPQGYRRPVAIVALACSLVAVFIAGTVARPYVNFTGAAGKELAWLGYQALERGDNQAAVDALEGAVWQPNAESGWWHNLGIAYQRENRDREAARAYRRAAEINPADSEARDAANWLDPPAERD
jgi:membrane associated rhomboid family serine protease